MSQKKTNLADSPQYFDQSLELIEQSFNYQKKYHYEDDFSLLFTPDNHKNCHLLIEGDKVLATIFLLPRILSNSGFETPVCFLGSLCADESIRGKGVFKKFLKSILHENRKKYSLMMLWSDLSELYQKFDFYEAGSVYEYDKNTINKEHLRSLTKATTLTQQDKQCIAKLYHKSYQDFFIPKRSSRDWELLFNHPTIDLYIEKQEQEIIHYAFINKGMDLQNIIHESSARVLPKDTDFKIWSPHSSGQGIQKYAAFIKINDNVHFKDLISEMSANAMIIDSLTEDKVLFKFNDEAFSLSIQDFIGGVFGPAKFKEFMEFQADFWVPGFESV